MFDLMEEISRMKENLWNMGYGKHKEETRLRLDLSGSQLENVQVAYYVVGCQHWSRPGHGPRVSHLAPPTSV